ncbi:DUF3040 domain-containing protein [Hoyosella subflava]|uniref:Transmembrane protein n=1 Tax=Hoyosella subflava (strain DSM 45089 / JCM 17490 / NBRC 109087 / DQS3-9A1) TaxID=443218 RepID=F6EFF5_HOYSD|nr:DUF3040 domain-containing protein [Hoyosella subflava]AEF39768.1 Transmembrane protein [Hoyosella subflava DQS3-9A1]
MPLSEHEQRMLEQIESALYAEDPKFASQVRTASTRGASPRRRLQVAAIFLLGLVLLIAGVALPLKLGDFPILSLVGFLVMFGAGVWALAGNHQRTADGEGQEASTDSGASGKQGGKKPQPGARKPRGSSESFSKRMEERFRKRFEQ